jgi:hypothetical protein
MTKLFLAAGVAALAIAAPAAAERGGKGGGQQESAAAKPDRGGGGGGGQARQVERRGGGGGEMRAARMENRGEARQMRVVQREERRAQRVDRAARPTRVERQEVRTQRAANRVDRQEARTQRAVNRVDRQEARTQRIDNANVRSDVRMVDNRFTAPLAGNAMRAGWMDGCPPGLVPMNGGCMPPGQVKKMMVGQMLPARYSDSLLPLALRDLYRDTDDYYYRYGNGYAYRVDRGTNLVAALLPLLGGGYSVGQMFPTSYMNSYVPDYYNAFYPDTANDYYRYANGYIYEIDPRSGMIEDIIPAYGYGYGVGDMMPSGYSYYNLPQQYRSFYPETDLYSYRYAPGAIYQVDRQSSLITAIASLLAPSLGVGQQLPMGYDAYNVPYQYRSQYYDTPTSWYRYSNGSIYQVDPTTRLITAVIDAIV